VNPRCRDAIKVSQKDPLAAAALALFFR